jgi:hypothetical protein
MTDDAARIADLERENAALRAGIERIKPPPVPAAVSYPDGHTTVAYMKNAVVLPTADELRRLEEIVYRAYPRLKAGGDSQAFGPPSTG